MLRTRSKWPLFKPSPFREAADIVNVIDHLGQEKQLMDSVFDRGSVFNLFVNHFGKFKKRREDVLRLALADAVRSIA